MDRADTRAIRISDVTAKRDANTTVIAASESQICAAHVNRLLDAAKCIEAALLLTLARTAVTKP